MGNLPNVDTGSSRNVHVGGAEAALDGDGQGLLPSKLNWHWLLLGLEEALSDSLAHHGEDAIVTKEQIEACQELAALLVALVLDSQRLQSKDLLDAPEFIREPLHQVLHPGLGLFLDDEANFGLLGGVGAVVLCGGNPVQRMGDLNPDGLGRRPIGHPCEANLHLHQLVVTEQLHFLLVALAGGGGDAPLVVPKEGRHGPAQEGGVEPVLGQGTGRVGLPAGSIIIHRRNHSWLGRGGSIDGVCGGWARGVS